MCASLLLLGSTTRPDTLPALPHAARRGASALLRQECRKRTDPAGRFQQRPAAKAPGGQDAGVAVKRDGHRHEAPTTDAERVPVVVRPQGMVPPPNAELD